MQSPKKARQKGGKKWEELCQLLFRLKHGDDGYQPIPSRFRGDLGIEGFTTRTGIAFQCYAPDNELTAGELFEAQKKKIQSDCRKLIKSDRTQKFLDVLGETKIRTWLFVTPKIENKDLHAERNKLIAKVKKAQCAHIDNDSFDIQFKTEEDYVIEMGKLCQIGEAVISVDIPDIPDDQIQEWATANSDHHKRLDNKLAKVNKDADSRAKNITSNIAMQLIGEAAMDSIFKKYPEQWERIRKTASTMERDVEDRSRNENLKGDSIHKMREEFYSRLEKEFGKAISENTMRTLAQFAVADWLIRCPLDFNE